MTDLSLNSAPSVNGLRTIVMENDLVRIIVLPEAGGKVWQITYKPLNSDLLWNNPNAAPSRLPIQSCYDDVWCGGWDELFPNDEAGTLLGHRLPDHGELWSGQWRVEPSEQADSARVHMQFRTPITNFLAEKTLSLRPDSAVLEVHYRLSNQSAETLPFLFKLHPAFAVTTSHRIDFPPMTVVREPDFPGTLDGAPLIFRWPHALREGAQLDLRMVPDVSAQAVHFIYGTELGAGWCGVTNRANRLSAALRFDPEVFSSCWLFASYGGWRDLNVAVLEPATGYPFNMQSMMEEGQARWLGPGECLETSVLFSMQEGLSSIGGVEENGRILPGDEA